MNPHKQLTEQLRKEMMGQYLAVHTEKNPLHVGLSTLTTEQNKYILSQYTIFPRKIISFLMIARKVANNNGWKKVSEELTRNIGEELGTQSGGISHYKMLVKGLADGIDPQLEKKLFSLKPSPATKKFIADMEAAVSTDDVSFALGATYALEASAVPELIIVKNAVNKLFIDVTGKPMQEGTLKNFFIMHLDSWEPGHEEGLRETTDLYLQNPDNFSKGFHAVMKAMDEWWISLADECA